MPFLPRVYADFNAIEYPADGSLTAEMPLTGYGTLASLSRQGLQLTEGMRLVVYEPSDIECEAVAAFDQRRTDPAGRSGEWIARLNHTHIRDNFTEKDEPNTHPCSGCGEDLNDLSKVQGRSYKENCPACGTSVMAPMAPPKSAA
jgi:hypothetical protein